MRDKSRIVCSKLEGVSVRALALLSIVFTLSGCSTISDSLSDSISKSVSSPFKWSSESSSGSSKESKETYQGDVRSYAEVSTRSNNPTGKIERGLAAIGEKHGISNWEADLTTFTGIGEGLAKAKATQQKVDVFKNGLAQGDNTRSAAIQKGYENGL